MKTIRLNSSGDSVKVAKYLTEYCAKNTATDIFDKAFEDHVKNWQAKNGLDADGVIGKKSWAAMANSAKTCSTSKNSKSRYVCAIQILVGGIDVDGIFGQNTKRAVSAFQSANKLVADGICGPKTWKVLLVITDESSDSGTSPTEKHVNKCVHYLQWDKRWKNIKYSTHTSEQTIGNSGCGPSSMAQIMATFIDKNITPVEMCDLAVKNGYRTKNNGTDWDFFKFVADKYSGFSKFAKTGSVNTLKAALKEGALAVTSMNSNDDHFWTKGGHFVTAIGYDDKGYIYANDPNKSSAPRKQQQDKFKSCMKQAFIFWP